MKQATTKAKAKAKARARAKATAKATANAGVSPLRFASVEMTERGREKLS